MEKIQDRNSPTRATSATFPTHLRPKWRSHFKDELDEPYFKDLMQFLKTEWNAGKIIYPARTDIFRALQEIDLEEVRVVILGQDPYHGPNQAIGRSFAVPNEHFPKPPSLQNIFKELEADLGIAIDRKKSDLSGWSRQGVLLLNTVMSVRASEAFSHRNKGWEIFTDKIIKALNDREKPIVFILWGSAAISKKAILDLKKHVVIESPHPSPLSAHRGFFGSKPFSRTNVALIKVGQKPIDWPTLSE